VIFQGHHDIISTSVACAVGPTSVTTSSTDFSFQNLVFLGNLFEFFNSRNHLNINISHILNPNLTYQIKIPLNPAHQSRSFQQHQRHIPIPPKFSATI
jgi:hypothetical protein